jgi:hypothetical protein
MKFQRLVDSGLRIPNTNIFAQVTVLIVHAVAQLVEALRYKQEGSGFDSR